ncbi:Bis(5'-nucleosyl)-tetraphosphatase, symmetrical [hydrothermal vent metagenome]|uniref:bis(5'-nucleosyl)-tetraphosphatase (symmetrical) n=1 Tax=hydrothermal vent metagenome TaxID=652676 RepID=A0A1W1CP64_9ZZZZ
MAVWAIGDIQGCYASFRKLLKKIDFNPKKDKLWVAGDLVNRGEGSLETLEYLYSIKESVHIVLGNHDITLIAIYYGLKKSNPTLDPIFASPNAAKLIDWLRYQKFLHVDYQLGYCMAHAGISPSFDLGMAMRYAKRIEMKLQGDNVKLWLEEMFSHGVDRLDKKSSEVDTDRYVISSFIRMRFCDEKNHLNFKQKGKPTEDLREKGLRPWFDCERKSKIDLKIIFGHWSTLGLYHDKNVLGLDTGCLWGEKLTVARIDKEKVEIVSLDCKAENISALED